MEGLAGDIELDDCQLAEAMDMIGAFATPQPDHPMELQDYCELGSGRNVESCSPNASSSGESSNNGESDDNAELGKVPDDTKGQSMPTATGHPATRKRGVYNLRTTSIVNRIETEIRQKKPRQAKAKPKPPPLSKYRRKTANARERTRMQQMNDAYEELREVVPDYPAGKITKITTLRLAMNYISALREMLRQNDEPTSPTTDTPEELPLDSLATNSIPSTSDFSDSQDSSSQDGDDDDLPVLGNLAHLDCGLAVFSPDCVNVLDSEGESINSYSS